MARLLALLALVALAVGCRSDGGESGNPATPRETVERYLGRVQKADLDGARRLLCADERGNPLLEGVAAGNPSFVTPARLGELTGFTFQSEGALSGAAENERWLRFDLRGGAYDNRTLGFAVRPEPATGFCVLYAL